MINFNNQKSLSFSQNLGTFSLESAQSGRLLPKWIEDTKMFFDDVYNKGTRGKKYQADSVQYGRSMIEMLGVLAIIGVLSVGGIAGYSKAMTKFKINKTIEQISHIVANTRTLYGSQPNYGDITDAIIKKAHLAPDDMWETGSSGKLINAFGGSVSIQSADKNNPSDKKAFSVIFYGIPDDACIELSTQDWGAATGSGLIAVTVGHSDSAIRNRTLYVNCAGSSSSSDAVACPNGSSVSVPMPISIAATACGCDGNQFGGCAFAVKYY